MKLKMTLKFSHELITASLIPFLYQVMHLEPLETKNSRKSLRMSAAQKTSLITAWTLIKPNLKSHARNIFAYFYDRHREYLRLFDNDTLHSHTEIVLQSFTSLIDNGLNDCIMEEICKRCHEHITRQDVMRLNEIIGDYVLRVLKRHMTRTLREAIEILLTSIELKFRDELDVKNMEI